MDDDIHGWYPMVTWFYTRLSTGSVNASLVVDDRFMVHDKVSCLVDKFPTLYKSAFHSPSLI